MFMSANEITARYQPLDADREEDGWSGPETNDELWERKANEAWDEGLAQGIIEHGVKKPVSLGQAVGSEGKPQIVGGHHRLAVMREESPDEAGAPLPRPQPSCGPKLRRSSRPRRLQVHVAHTPLRASILR